MSFPISGYALRVHETHVSAGLPEYFPTRAVDVPPLSLPQIPFPRRHTIPQELQAHRANLSPDYRSEKDNGFVRLGI